MKIHELDKLATPGPMNALEEVVFCPTPSDPTRGHIPLAWLYPVGIPNANAKMFAHCRNNFMRALKALKRHVDQCPICAGSGVNRTPTGSEQCEFCYADRMLIVELEEVK